MGMDKYGCFMQMYVFNNIETRDANFQSLP